MERSDASGFGRFAATSRSVGSVDLGGVREVDGGSVDGDQGSAGIPTAGTGGKFSEGSNPLAVPIVGGVNSGTARPLVGLMVGAAEWSTRPTVVPAKDKRRQRLAGPTNPGVGFAADRQRPA
jgi:hypothetical protein